MTGILLLAVVVLGIVVANLVTRVKTLSRRIDLLEREYAPVVAVAERPPVIAAPPMSAVETVSQPWSARPTEPVEPVEPLHEPASEPGPELERGWSRPGLEALIGARLPVWIGAVALIAAGFFLVRYAIESGLLGPGVRTFAAGLFALVLVAASEAARRLPATADDPRIAQSLAGAGIASAYGALYLAAALYDLVPPLPAFV